MAIAKPPKAKSKPNTSGVRSGGQDPRARANAVAERLARAVPTPKIELDHGDAWQLLVATILSAQSTDKTINRVTPILFARYPTPRELAEAETEELEAIVKPTGFFRNKAKSIRGASAVIAERFGGRVPRTMDELLTLPGVARKTANVVLGEAFGIAAGIVVDTHVGRVAQRLELSKDTDPEKIERALCEAFPKESWIEIGQRLLLHGRYVCKAKKPACTSCPVSELCPSREVKPEGSVEARTEIEANIIRSGGE